MFDCWLCGCCYRCHYESSAFMRDIESTTVLTTMLQGDCYNASVAAAVTVTEIVYYIIL